MTLFSSITKLLASSALTACLISGTAAAQTFSDEQKQNIEQVVRDYLLKNPEILIEMQTELERKQTEAQQLAQKQVLEAEKVAIFESPLDPVIGNPDGDVTIVEFFDYNCGYCKRAMEDMNQMVKADNNLRFVLKEFPILGPQSLEAHRVAAAFKTLYGDKYPDFHQQMMTSPGQADETKAIRIATGLGAEETKLREEMQKPYINESFQKNYQISEALGISGTPSYVVGDEVVFGAQGALLLTSKVANMRECESTVC